MIKIVALAGALADAGKHGVTAVGFGDVVDEFENDDGLSDAGATEGSGFAALDERSDEVDDLDAGLKNGGLGILIGECRSGPMDRIFFVVNHWAAAVDRCAGDVENAAEDAVAHRHGNRRAGVDDGHATLQALGG